MLAIARGLLYFFSKYMAFSKKKPKTVFVKNMTNSTTEYDFFSKLNGAT